MAVPAPAQSSPGGSATDCPPDSVDQGVFISLGPAPDGEPGRVLLTPEEAERLSHMLLLILGDWQMPRVALRPGRDVWDDPQREVQPIVPVPSITRWLSLELDIDGRLRVVAESTPSDVPPLDSAVRAAVARASESRVLAFLAAPDSTANPGSASTTALRLEVRSAPDSLRPTARVGSLRLPRFVESPAVLLDRFRLDYPDDWAEGRIIVEFVVNTSGRADMRTFRVIEGRDSRLIASATAGIRRARFRPATRNGCAVSMWVQMPLEFTLER